MRKDIKKYNSKAVKMTVEENKSLKIPQKILNKRKQEIIKLKNERGEVKTNRHELLQLVKEFYAEL